LKPSALRAPRARALMRTHRRPHLSIAAMSRYLSSKDPNTRYLASEHLARLALVAEVAAALKDHRETVVANLKVCYPGPLRLCCGWPCMRELHMVYRCGWWLPAVGPACGSCT
jgi:hypothetical protein